MKKHLISKTATWLVLPITTIFLVSCDGAKSDFAGLETTKEQGQDAPCAISTFTPSAATIKASGSSNGVTKINVSPNNSLCNVEYYLNGNLLNGITGIAVEIPSSILAAGANTLVAKVTGAKLSTILPTQQQWTLTKNSLPVCSNQVPAAAGNVTGIGGRFDMAAAVADSDNDTMSAAWYINGTAAGSAVTSTLANGALNGSITTTNSHQGTIRLKALISDGTDASECVWDLAVNQQCAFSSFSPTPPGASTEVRVANAGTTSTQFIAVPNNNNCAVSWMLNGSSIGGADTILPVLSSTLNSGTNTLRAVATDGTTVATHEWTIRKNTPPACAFQNPAASGVTYTLGSSNLLTAMGSDTENDPITWNWRLNNTIPAAGVFITASSGTTSLTTFNALGGVVNTGANTVSASISDGYDSAACEWALTVTNACTIVSTVPSGATTKVAASANTSTSFSVTASDAGCPLSWTLNGAPLSGTSATRVLQSSALLPGGNTLVATATNGSKTWFVTKNIPPTCGTQSPGTTNNTLGVGLASTFTETPADNDDPSGPFTYSWKLNGLAIPSQVVTSVNGSSTVATAVFTPIASQTGNTNLSVDVNDGYDSVTCNWTSSVQPECSVSSTNPSSATYKVSSVGSATNQFVVSPNDASCQVEWKINGGSVVATGNSANIVSSTLNTGDNTVSARVFNSTSTSTRNWTVTKNTAPTCASQTPATTGVVFGVSGTQAFLATAGNTDADTLSFAWKVNGNTVAGAILSPTSQGPNASEGLFIPNNSYIGANTIVSTINDGTDTATCTWSVTVKPNCAISSSIPSSATDKISASNSASATFGVVPNDSSCIVNWELNGQATSTNVQFVNVSSSSLNSGSNTLVANVSNGTSSVTRTWTVNKNRVPVCASQTPSTGSSITVDVGNHQNFSAIVTDQDSDTLTMSWLLNANTTGSFDQITANGVTNTYTSRLTPSVGQVGQGQIVGVSANDGYDTQICQWGVNVNDPNTVSIQACLPAGNPVVIMSTGNGSDKDFTVSATGTGLSYKWELDSSEMSGYTSPNVNLTAAGLSVGVHTLKAIVSDTYNNQVNCTFSVKRNAKPVLSNPVPNLSTLFRVNYANTIPMGITATDGNSDPLGYTWKVDSVVNTNYLATGATTSTYDPKSDTNALGPHTVSVDVTDGYETSTYSWNIQVTTFTDVCNNLMNGTVGGAGGTGSKICTLSGYPGVGHGINPSTADPSLVRIRPMDMVEDELGNLIFSDNMSHVIWYYNRSGVAVTKFGQSIGAGKLAVILGAGSNGNSNTANIAIGGTSGLGYKLSTPEGIAYDTGSKILYITDHNNHRVIYLKDDTNYPQLILGGNGTTNDAARNAANALGSAHSCAEPMDVAIYGTGANRRLYTACYASNAVKVTNIDYEDAGNFGKTDILVGRMPTITYPGGAYTGTVTIGGFSNGDLGRNGDAEILGPTSISADPLGRLYIWENYGVAPYPTSRGYYSMRLKVANVGSTTLNVLDNGSMSWTTWLWAEDITTSAPNVISARSATTATNSNGDIQATRGVLSASPVPATHNLMITGAEYLRTNGCMPYLITPRFSTAAGALAAPLTVNLATTDASGNFYSNNNCSSSTIASVNMTTGQLSQIVYYKTSAVTSGKVITFSGTNFTSATLTYNSYTAGTSHNALRVTIPNVMHYSDCVPMIIQAMNGSTPQTVSSNRVIRLYSDGQVTMYTSSTCTGSPVNRITMASGTGENIVYMSKKVVVEPNQIAVLLGTIMTNYSSGANRYSVNYFTNPTAGVPDASYFLAWNNYGAEIDWNTTTNSLRGIFLNLWDYHRVLYLNLSGSTMNFGLDGATSVQVENGDVMPVIDYNGSCAMIDSSNGPSSRICNPRKVQVSADYTKLYVSDYSNGRIKSFNLSSLATGGSNYALPSTTVVGTGYFRYLSGNFNDSATPAVDVRMNRPYRAFIDTADKKLYFSDQAYCRVRNLDMLSGMVSTTASRGCGDQTYNDDALYIYSRDIKDVHVATLNGTKWLFYSDSNNNGNDTANSTSVIRAVNMGLSSASVFGQTIAGGQAGVVAGNYTSGTGSWALTGNGSPLNSDNMVGVNARLFNPDGLAVDPNTSSMYIGLRSDHCIVKLKSDGTITRMIGACNAASPGAVVDGPAWNGANPLANVRMPGKIVMDPAYPSSGNFFFTDFGDSTLSRVRYVNFLEYAVPFGNVNATQGTASNPTITTIFTTTTASVNGYTMGLAAFDRQICVANGYWNSDGNNSPHNVMCKDRFNANFSSNTSLVIGPDPSVSVMRGGSPLGIEQEGIMASSATLLGPTDIEFDADGNLYIVEAGNHLIRFVRRWW